MWGADAAQKPAGVGAARLQSEPHSASASTYAGGLRSSAPTHGTRAAASTHPHRWDAAVCTAEVGEACLPRLPLWA